MSQAHVSGFLVAKVVSRRLMGMDSLVCDSDLLQPTGFLLGHHQPCHAGIPLSLDCTSSCRKST